MAVTVGARLILAARGEDVTIGVGSRETVNERVRKSFAGEIMGGSHITFPTAEDIERSMTEARGLEADVNALLELGLAVDAARLLHQQGFTLKEAHRVVDRLADERNTNGRNL